MDNNKISSVLFDLDGTLLDTADDLGAALNYVLSQHSMPAVSPEIYRPVASDGAKGLLELGFGDQLREYNYESLRKEFLDYYQQNIAQHTKLYPGIAKLLTTLDNKSIPWGIVTNKPKDLTLLLLPHYQEFNTCKVMVAGDTLTKRKPDPEPILFACEQMNQSPDTCLYIGDALRDIQAGNRATNVTGVANWGYIKATDNTSSWDADFLFEVPDDILMII